MSYAGGHNGSQNITQGGGSGVVGISGNPTTLYSVHMISGGTASVLTLRNGTTGSATAWLSLTGSVSSGTTYNFEGGIHFPAGIYASIDANLTNAVFSFEDGLT